MTDTFDKSVTAEAFVLETLADKADLPATPTPMGIDDLIGQGSVTIPTAALGEPEGLVDGIVHYSKSSNDRPSSAHFVPEGVTLKVAGQPGRQGDDDGLE